MDDLLTVRCAPILAVKAAFGFAHEVEALLALGLLGNVRTNMSDDPKTWWQQALSLARRLALWEEMMPLQTIVNFKFSVLVGKI